MTEPSTARNRQGRTRTSKWVTADEVDVKIEKLAESRSWKVALALDLPFDEREDIQQDLHFALWKRLRRFDPSRGALTTFLFRVANNEASKIIGNRIAARRDYRRCVGLNSGGVVCHIQRPARREERLILRLDIGCFIDSLPPKLRRVAIALKTCSRTEVAGQLRISRETVYERIHELRVRYESWLRPCIAPGQPTTVLRVTQ